MAKKSEKKIESSLAGWNQAIQESANQHRKTEEEWRKSIGEPFLIYEKEDFKYGFWKVEDGVLQTRIGKNGPILGYCQTFSKELIEKLVATLNS